MIVKVVAKSDLHKEELYNVVSILKAGNLDEPNVQFDDRAGTEIKNYLDKEFINNRSKAVVETASILASSNMMQNMVDQKRSSVPAVFDTPDMFETIKLSSLRDWCINVFEIEDFCPYIYGIFKDYDLF